LGSMGPQGIDQRVRLLGEGLGSRSSRAAYRSPRAEPPPAAADASCRAMRGQLRKPTRDLRSTGSKATRTAIGSHGPVMGVENATSSKLEKSVMSAQSSALRGREDRLRNPEASLTPHPIDPGVRIGHVHLKVADLERALAFYCGVLGFELMQRYGNQAAFISAGGYHHHIALNTWDSKDGSPPPPGSTSDIAATIVFDGVPVEFVTDVALRTAPQGAFRRRPTDKEQDSRPHFNDLIVRCGAGRGGRTRSQGLPPRPHRAPEEDRSL
jgi:catechol 2,3-dioxygenase-like lactoylglutathione lyase family enzyme